jgi:phenylpyruvate tautomerase PptA (4-oxalocrotonate tautomerase family)
MPVYECLTTVGTLDQLQRNQFAEALTRIHCEETGAPPDFVHIYFKELPEGHSFTAGRVARPTFIRAIIRKGRPQSVREAILKRASTLFEELTGASQMSIVLGVFDVPPSWGMEAGMILPETTQAHEDAWFEKVGQSKSVLPNNA